MLNQDTIVILNYISVFIVILCSVLISTQKSSKMQKLALLLSVSIAISSIALLLKYEVTDASSYILTQIIAYPFSIHASFFMLLFVLEYARFKMPKWFMWVLEGLNLIISFVIITMNHHPYFYKSYTVIMNGKYITLDKEYGIFHTLAVALICVYMVLIISTIVIFFIKNVRRRSAYAIKLLVSALIPFSAYIIPKIIGDGVEFHLFSLAIFSILLIYLIYGNNLYDVENMASKLTIWSLDEGFIVFDDRYHFKGLNDVAEEIFPIFKELDLDSNILKYDESFKGYIDGDVTEYRKDNKVYKITSKTVKVGTLVQGKVIKIDDVTIEKMYMDLLKEKQARMEKDLDMAKSIQLSNLPSADITFKAVDKLDVAAFMRTAKEVGGDFYDFYMLDDKRALFLIADASGKGIPAALFMMRAKAVIKGLAEEKLNVSEIFTRANNELERENDTSMFLTSWIGILDIETGKMTFANAGHNAPVIIREGNDAEFLRGRSGMFLGGISGAKYIVNELELSKGDRLFLYTDGVTEATNIEEVLYGENRLKNAMNKTNGLSSKETIDSILSDIDRFVGNNEQFDDITMVMIKYI